MPSKRAASRASVLAQDAVVLSINNITDGQRGDGGRGGRGEKVEREAGESQEDMARTRKKKEGASNGIAAAKRWCDARRLMKGLVGVEGCSTRKIKGKDLKVATHTVGSASASPLQIPP